ncbi:hypothetical protein NM688_g1879 [Phlebia brevispora]|uniref:Uncharacterized protein n=1 Tax=Phlebia brevispora TaxID=194682 RepID=A0ACC1TAA9_9APHY|nr:hypothetical protein NM688_g1879 [Phlebia brevispora]
MVLPDNFIECRPEALEMYVCRNMHVVMSCKKALHGYLREHKGSLTDLGADLTDEAFDRMFEDAMWEYDSFKRRRLNWPEDYPGLQMRMDEDDPDASNSRSLFNLEGRRRAQSTGRSFTASPSADNCTQVRIIRIFGATKANELR